MLSAIREVQIPFLAAMLVGGCGAKAFRVLRAREMMAALGPTALMPLRLRRPIAIGMCSTVEPKMTDLGGRHRAACHLAAPPPGSA